MLKAGRLAAAIAPGMAESTRVMQALPGVSGVRPIEASVTGNKTVTCMFTEMETSRWAMSGGCRRGCARPAAAQ